MDYLTIIATRSLVLFPTPAAKQTHSHTRSSSPESPIAPVTPTTPQTPVPRPGPVAMPMGSILYADTECAYYLLTHVFTHPSMYPTEVMIGGITKELAKEAEVLVWKEIDKAKMFIRALGQWFSSSQGPRISEAEMQTLAEMCGLRVDGHEKEVEVDIKEDELLHQMDQHVSEDTVILA